MRNNEVWRFILAWLEESDHNIFAGRGGAVAIIHNFWRSLVNDFKCLPLFFHLG